VAIYGPVLSEADGTREFAELVYLGLKELGIEEVEVLVDNNGRSDRFLGLQMRDVRTIQLDEYDRIILVFLKDGEAGYLELRELGVAPDKIVTLFNAKTS
jgi:hypothetical protein